MLVSDSVWRRPGGQEHSAGEGPRHSRLQLIQASTHFLTSVSAFQQCGLLSFQITCRTVPILRTIVLASDILVRIRIRIRGSVPLTDGSGFGSCYYRPCGSGAGSVPLTNRSGSGYRRSKNIRIHNTTVVLVKTFKTN
jgi:hypothetical protein